MILLHSFVLISFSIFKLVLSGIFSSGSSKIFNLQYFESLFEYSSIASLKNYSFTFPIHITFIVSIFNPQIKYLGF